VRTEDFNPAEARSVQRTSGRLLDFIIIGTLLLVIAMLIVGRLPFYRQTGESILQKKHRGASLERSFAALRQRLRGETMKRNLMILPMKTEESNLGFNILLPFFSPLR
jgi:hypothetical protein